MGELPYGGKQNPGGGEQVPGSAPTPSGLSPGRLQAPTAAPMRVGGGSRRRNDVYNPPPGPSHAPLPNPAMDGGFSRADGTVGGLAQPSAPVRVRPPTAPTPAPNSGGDDGPGFNWRTFRNWASGGFGGGGDQVANGAETASNREDRARFDTHDRETGLRRAVGTATAVAAPVLAVGGAVAAASVLGPAAIAGAARLGARYLPGVVGQAVRSGGATAVRESLRGGMGRTVTEAARDVGGGLVSRAAQAYRGNLLVRGATQVATEEIGRRGGGRAGRAVDEALGGDGTTGENIGGIGGALLGVAAGNRVHQRATGNNIFGTPIERPASARTSAPAASSPAPRSRTPSAAEPPMTSTSRPSVVADGGRPMGPQTAEALASMPSAPPARPPVSSATPGLNGRRAATNPGPVPASRQAPGRSTTNIGRPPGDPDLSQLSRPPRPPGVNARSPRQRVSSQDMRDLSGGSPPPAAPPPPVREPIMSGGSEPPMVSPAGPPPAPPARPAGRPASRQAPGRPGRVTTGTDEVPVVSSSRPAPASRQAPGASFSGEPIRPPQEDSSPVTWSQTDAESTAARVAAGAENPTNSAPPTRRRSPRSNRGS